MSERFDMADGTKLPHPISSLVHTHRWQWARDDGWGTCAVKETDHGNFLHLIASLRSPGNKPPEPGSITEDATMNIAADFLASIVAHRMREGYIIAAMDKNSAVLLHPGTTITSV